MPEKELLHLISIGQAASYANMQPLIDKLLQCESILNNDIINHCISEFQWLSESKNRKVYLKEKDCEFYFQKSHYKLMQELYRLAGFTPARAIANMPAMPSHNPYIKYIMELALKEESKQVKIENWAPSLCPTCGSELSTHHGDGYYSNPTFLEYCPYCRQHIRWTDTCN